MTTLTQMLHEMKAKFQQQDIFDPAFEARALLTGLLDFDSLDIATKGDQVLTEDQMKRAQQAVNERVLGKPVYRILGWREFYGLRFELSQATLEPRPDTEILVEEMLPLVEQVVLDKGSCSLLDFGTGSGAIALSILANSQHTSALGVDQSADALTAATKNAHNLGLEDRFSTLQSDWATNVVDRFDIVVSNPPYIVTKILEDLAVEVKDHDPLLALDGGIDGLDAYRKLAEQIPKVLKSGGFVGLEIGYDQADSVAGIFQNAGFIFKSQHKDLSGQDRVLLFQSKKI
jgi:release factor glutamine methyltransferase